MVVAWAESHGWRGECRDEVMGDVAIEIAAQSRADGAANAGMVIK